MSEQEDLTAALDGLGKGVVKVAHESHIPLVAVILVGQVSDGAHVSTLLHRNTDEELQAILGRLFMDPGEDTGTVVTTGKKDQS